MKLLVITGPTATGKTALAAELAHRLGTAVVSVDSRQVYRGLDLGTGKDLEEYRRFSPAVPYRLIDIADPRETFSLFQYQEACYAALEELAAAGRRTAVLAGGTGMYLEAVLRRFRIANVPENPALRASLADRSREELEALLRSRSPEVAARTDMSSRKRILRGLIRDGLVTAVHDLSDGGLAVALAEMAMASGIGATVDPATAGDPVAAFFGEDQGHYVLTAQEAHLPAIRDRAATAGVSAVAIGTTGGPDLKLGAARAISVVALAEAHEGWFPGFMAGH